MTDLDKYLQSCVQIEPLVIEEEFARLPTDLAYWNERYAAAYEQWLKSKAEVDRLYGQCYINCRAQLEAGKARVGVDEVKSAVEVEASYVAARRFANSCESEKVRLYGVLDAIRSKRECLISLGAHQRAEIKAGYGQSRNGSQPPDGDG